MGVESGASSRICCNRDFFQEFEENEDTIFLTGDYKMVAKAEGTIRFIMKKCVCVCVCRGYAAQVFVSSQGIGSYMHCLFYRHREEEWRNNFACFFSFLCVANVDNKLFAGASADGTVVTDIDSRTQQQLNDK